MPDFDLCRIISRMLALPSPPSQGVVALKAFETMPFGHLVDRSSWPTGYDVPLYFREMDRQKMSEALESYIYYYIYIYISLISKRIIEFLSIFHLNKHFQ